MTQTSNFPELELLIKSESDCQETRKTLEESNRNLSVFAHAIAHELRSPVHVIAGYCNLLIESNFSPPDRAMKWLKSILSSMARLDSTIDAMLEMSELNGTISIEPSVDLNTVAGQVLDELRLEIQGSGATVTFDRLPVVRANQNLIVQLFKNLIGNAIKFCRDMNPNVTITAKQAGRSILISFADNGIGISADDQRRLFRYFGRLNAREQFQGNGLGLAICKRIVELHGGNIWVESQPGTGSTFYVELPLSA